jgi:ABC-type multidrug transport system fused ATPase/permease subunit
MLFAVTLDLIGVGLIAPLVTLITFGENRTLAPAFANQPRLMFLILGMILIAVYVTKGILAYKVNRRIVVFGEQNRARLAKHLMQAYQKRDWSFHLRHGSSEIVSKIVWHTNIFSSNTLIPVLRLATDSLVFVLIVLLLATRNFSAVLLLLALFGVAFIFMHRRLRQRLQVAQKTLALAHATLIAAVTQAIGGFREIRVLGVEEHFLDEVTNCANTISDASGDYSALGQVPRYVIEAVMVSFIVILATIQFAMEGSAASIMPIVGTFAVAGIRLMPSVTSMISSFNSIRSSRYVVRELAEEMLAIASQAYSKAEEGARLASIAPRVLERGKLRDVVLKTVRVSYQDDSAPALKGIDLTIQQGEAVGLMGPSGAGKSTLADTILGFLVPQAGSIEVNGVNIHANLAKWLAMTAYIPQAAYMLNDTLRRNITFGEPIEWQDEGKLLRAVELAQLREVVGKLPDGLETVVGERGIRLSGGQRQRIALARALYHDREFIILDEATAALDMDTEREIVAAIKSLHGLKTLLIIAHRESTLDGCDRIIRLQDGCIFEASIEPSVTLAAGSSTGR